MKQFFVTMEIIAVTWWEAENIPDTKSFIFIQPQESPIPPTAFSSFVTKCSDSGIAEAYRAWKMQFLDPHNEGYGPPPYAKPDLKKTFFNTPLYQTAEKSLCTCKDETLGMFCNEASLIEWGRRCQYGFNGLVAHLAFDLQTCSWISIAVAN